jgi:hypothetical protein
VDSKYFEEAAILEEAVALFVKLFEILRPL